MPLQFTDISENPTDARLAMAMQMLLQTGPDRVVCNSEGLAVSPAGASRNRIKVEVIYVRSDGWSLGTPERFCSAALRLWRRDWVCRIDTRTRTWHRMARGRLAVEPLDLVSSGSQERTT